MSLSQLLDYLRFLRWHRSSCKIKDRKFFRYSFSVCRRCTSVNRSSVSFKNAVGRPFPPRLRCSIDQIIPSPFCHIFMIWYFKPSGGFTIAEFFSHHGLYDPLLKLPCVSLVWYSSWHNKSTPLGRQVYYTCLPNGVQFIPVRVCFLYLP